MRLVFWGFVIRLAAHEAEMDLITIYKILLIDYLFLEGTSSLTVFFADTRET